MQVLTSSEGQNIFVVDTAISETSLEELSSIVRDARYTTKSASSDEKKLYSETMSELNVVEFYKSELSKEILELLGQIDDFKEDEYECDEVLVNLSRFGDYSFVHCDVEAEGYVSVLLYDAVDWSAEWGGETVFFEKNYDAFSFVRPKKGRVAIYNSNILHVAGTPNKLCPVNRHSVSVRYKKKLIISRV